MFSLPSLGFGLWVFSLGMFGVSSLLRISMTSSCVLLASLGANSAMNWSIFLGVSLDGV